MPADTDAIPPLLMIDEGPYANVFPKPPLAAHTRELRQCMSDGLTRLWQSHALCDYTLAAEGRSFRVHRAVLASVSDYFYAMLTNGMKEAQQDYVELKAINPDMLQLLLDYVYTGNLHITDDNVIDLLTAAAHLQISTAITACLSFIEGNISVDICVEILEIARLYSCDKDFVTKTEEFVADNLSFLIRSGNYLKLSFDSLKGLLCREELMYGPEEKLYHAVVRWLEHDPEKRMQFHISLMEHIRFPLMTANQVDTILETCSELTYNPVLNKVLKQAQDYLSKPVHKRPLCQTGQTRLRMKPRFLTIQNEGEGWFALSTEKDKWFNVQKVDFPEIHQAGHITVNDFLVTCGGALNISTQDADEVTGKCFIFDPREYKWTELASMCVPRQDVALVEHKGFLYALGGSDGSSVAKEIERYSFEANEWEIFTNMYPECNPTFGVNAACVINDRIYTCDGLPKMNPDAGEAPNKMAFLDIPTKTWQMAPMKQEHKCGVPMWCHADLVYAVHTSYIGQGRGAPYISWYDPRTGDSDLVRSPVDLMWEADKIVADNEKVYFIHSLYRGESNEVVIKDKTVWDLIEFDIFPGKESTEYFVKLCLPGHQFIFNEEV